MLINKIKQNVSAPVAANGGLMCQSFLCHIFAVESFSTVEMEAGVA